MYVCLYTLSGYVLKKQFIFIQFGIRAKHTAASEKRALCMDPVKSELELQQHGNGGQGKITTVLREAQDQFGLA